MDNNLSTVSKLRFIAIILTVVFMGLSILGIGLTIAYEKTGVIHPCDLCFKINPQYEECINYTPLNFLWNTSINFTS